MIRVSVHYPNKPDKKYDWDYYLNKHIVWAIQKLEPLGLLKTEIDKGVASNEPGAPPPFLAAAYMYFNTMEDFQKCTPVFEESALDIPNYTDIEPVIQISEIIQQ